jgi:hypothetical protein
MADTVTVKTQKLTREQIASALGGNPRAIKLFESLLSDVGVTLPDATQQAIDTADAAKIEADAAQVLATTAAATASAAQAAAAAAQATATAAQADIDATQAQQLVTAAGSALLPNSRVLTAGTNTTVDTATPGQIKINATGGSGGGGAPLLPFGPAIQYAKNAYVAGCAFSATKAVLCTESGSTSTYIFDRTTGLCTATGNLNSIPLSCGARMCLGPDGNVYYFYTNATDVLNVEKYDISTGVWSLKATTFPTGYNNGKSILLTSGPSAGKIAVFCSGSATATLYAYDTATDTKSAISTSSPLTSGVWASACLLGTGKILFCGQNASTLAYLFDQSTLTFSSAANMPSSVWQHSLEVNQAGDAVFIGGYGRGRGIWTYKAADDSWQDMGDILRFDRSICPACIKWPDYTLMLVGGGSATAEVWSLANF